MRGVDAEIGERHQPRDRLDVALARTVETWHAPRAVLPVPQWCPSATSESAPALGVGRGVVELVVVIQARLIRLGELLAVQFDVGR